MDSDNIYYDENKKKIWSIQIDLLKELLRICNENNLECFVIWGTLLGAVRHKGFIPWDDDLDVAMPRESFDRLYNLSQNTFTSPFFLQTAKTDKEFFFSYARLRNTNTTGIIKDFSSPNYNNGIFIDIYPMDGICQNRKKYKIQRFMIDITAALARAKTGHRKNNLKSIVLKMIAIPFSYDNLCDIHQKWCKKNNGISNRVGLVYNRNLLKNYQFEKECIGDIVMLPFEDIMVPAPEKYDKLLKSVYGDYMTPPPVEKRGTWHNDQLIYDPDCPYLEYYRKRENSK